MSTVKISDPDAPDFLFKYQSISKYSLSNLAQKRLWASKPSDFNDPFEFNYKFEGQNSLSTDLDKIINDVGNLKVVCFAQECDNLLMWSHYADQHKGMCLMFENQFLTYPVNYTEMLPKVDFNVSGKARIVEFLNIMLSKSPEWSYERERRMTFMPEADQLVRYPGNLKSIYFGFRTTDSDIQLVRALINEPHVEFYKCKLNEHEYKLSFDRI